MSEGGPKKSKSKLSSMIVEKEEGPAEASVNVFYSKDNWETNEQITLNLDESTTISRLTDLAICQLPSLGTAKFDNNKQNFYMMMFKKKRQKPNYDYPICNPDSIIKDYDKYNFCLMEKKCEEKEEIINKNESNENEKKMEEKKGGDDKNNLNNENKEKNKNKEENKEKNGKKGKKEKKCMIF